MIEKLYNVINYIVFDDDDAGQFASYWAIGEKPECWGNNAVEDGTFITEFDGKRLKAKAFTRSELFNEYPELAKDFFKEEEEKNEYQ